RPLDSILTRRRFPATSSPPEPARRARALLTVVAVLAAVAATQAPAATNATPRWHVLPFAPGQGQWFSVLGSASGRVWFNVEGATGFTVWSARVRGGALTSFVSTPEGRITAFSDAWLSGSTLVSCCQGQEGVVRSEEHTSELQSLAYLVCRLLLEKKKKK